GHMEVRWWRFGSLVGLRERGGLGWET
ncbi:MAG: hypothetical protein JWN10_1511, partial [Solirubrobacterales bacterium]|nr:hypothetical protein [Solirubrobacterales bacterium]